MPKMMLTVKETEKTKEIVGAWLDKSVMQELGVRVNDFIFAQSGWSGAISTRAVVKGELPAGYAKNTILLTPDRIYDGNMREGMTVKVHKHDDWF